MYPNPIYGVLYNLHKSITHQEHSCKAIVCSMYVSMYVFMYCMYVCMYTEHDILISDH